MLLCAHELIEFREEVDEGMHCQGWICRQCSHLAVGECHHTSWCREDFCGAQPVAEEQPAVTVQH